MKRAVTVFLPLTGLLVILQLAEFSARQAGVDKDNVYRHPRTGFEFAVPVDWTVLATGQSSDGGDQMYLRYSGSPKTYVAIWMKPETNTPAEVDARLRLAVKMKTDQRGGASRYAFRPDSIHRKYVGEHQAESAVGEFLQDDRKTIEYFTWIFTEHTRVQFDIRGAEDGAALVNSALNEIIRTARIP
jgi:flavin-dependent dehydrogenase